jgi:hypothetical protein
LYRYNSANKNMQQNNGLFGQQRQGGGNMDPGMAATDALSARNFRG